MSTFEKIGNRAKKILAISGWVLLAAFLAFSIWYISGTHPKREDYFGFVTEVKVSDAVYITVTDKSPYEKDEDQGEFILQFSIPLNGRCVVMTTGDKFDPADIDVGDMISLSFKSIDYEQEPPLAVPKGAVEVVPLNLSSDNGTTTGVAAKATAH